MSFSICNTHTYLVLLGFTLYCEPVAHSNKLKEAGGEKYECNAGERSVATVGTERGFQERGREIGTRLWREGISAKRTREYVA